MEEVPLAVAVHRDEIKVAAPSSGKKVGQDSDDDEDSDDDGGGGGRRGRGKRGVMEAQLSLPEVVNVNVTHAMVSAVRKKAVALAQDSVTTGARSSSRQPFRVRNYCGEALALTVRRSGDAAEGGGSGSDSTGSGSKDEVRFTLEDGAEDTVDFGSFPAAAAAAAVVAAAGDGVSLPGTPARSRSRATTTGSSSFSGAVTTPVAAAAAATTTTTPARLPPPPLSSTLVHAQAPRWEPIASSGMSERRCVCVCVCDDMMRGVCVCVCVCVRVCAYMHICMYICVYVRICVHVCACSASVVYAFVIFVCYGFCQEEGSGL